MVLRVLLPLLKGRGNQGLPSPDADTRHQTFKAINYANEYKTMCHTTRKATNLPILKDDSSGRRRAVAFDKIEVYGFPTVLGDNPTAEGAPLRLDSNPDYRLLLHVDDYERRRPPRRHAEELRLSSLEREYYLLSTGYRYDDVVNAAKRNERQRRERWESVEASNWDTYLVLIEDVRDFLRAFMQWVQEPQLKQVICMLLLAYFVALYFNER